MTKIVNKKLTPIYDFTALLTLIFSQVFVIILLFLFCISFFYIEKENILDKLFLLSTLFILVFITYFLMKTIIVALRYFFAHEECFCENGKFYYKKILFTKIKIKKFFIPVNEIISVFDLGKRVIEAEKNTPINYFKSNERIGIKLISGIEYKIWNYVRKRKLFSIDNRYDKDEDFFIYLEEIQKMIKEEQNKVRLNQKNKNLMVKYTSPLDERYQYILNRILDEEKAFISKKDDNFIINGDSEAIKNLEILKDMDFEEIDFYIFYINYLSKKEYEDKKVLVGYNGIDGKEVTMLKLKEDINEIRDSKSSFLK